MQHRLRRFAALVLAVCTLAGCAGWGASETAAASAVPAVSPAPAPTGAGDPLSGMTLREKVCQLFIVRPDALDPAQTQDRIDDADAAGVTALTDAMRETLDTSPVGGVVLFVVTL